MNTYSIGIDVGGTNTSIGLVNQEGEVLTREHLSTASYFDSEAFLSDITEKIINVAKQCQNIKELAGVGFAAPNGNFYHGTIEYAPNLNFKGIIKVKEVVEQKLKEKGLPLTVTLTN